MKRLLLIVLASLAALSPVVAQELQPLSATMSQRVGALRADDMPDDFTYADRTIPVSEGLPVGSPNYFAAAAIELPTLPGAVIKSIDFFTLSDKGKARIGIFEIDGDPSFTDPGALFPRQNTKCLSATTVQAKRGVFNHGVFTTPITMQEGKRYLVGFQIQCGNNKQTKTYGGLVYDHKPAHFKADMALFACNRASFTFEQGKDVPFDLYFGYESWGAPYIFVDIEDSQDRLDHVVAIASMPRELKQAKGATSITVPIQVTNLGEKPATSVTVKLRDPKLDRQVATDSQLQIAVGETKEIPFVLLGEYVAAGVYHMLGSATMVNRQPSALQLESPIKIHIEDAEQYKVLREVLLERFTTELCPNCPGMDPIQEEAVATLQSEGYHVNVLSHHVGFGQDWLTHPESMPLRPFFFSQYEAAPSIALNRTHIPDLMNVDNDGEKMQLIFDFTGKNRNVAHMVQVAKRVAAMEIPVAITGLRRTALNGDKASYEVDIETTDNLDYKDIYLSAFITESKIKAKNQKGHSDPGKPYLHNDVIRSFVYGALGKRIDVTGKKMTIAIDDVTFDPAWKKENCRIVVMLHQWLINRSPEQRRVYSTLGMHANAKEADAVVAVEDQPLAYAFEGRIFLHGQYDSYQVYDLAGRRLHSEARLPAGTYIVRALLNGRPYTSKVVVR